MTHVAIPRRGAAKTLARQSEGAPLDGARERCVQASLVGVHDPEALGGKRVNGWRRGVATAPAHRGFSVGRRTRPLGRWPYWVGPGPAKMIMVSGGWLAREVAARVPRSGSSTRQLRRPARRRRWTDGGRQPSRSQPTAFSQRSGIPVGLLARLRSSSAKDLPRDRDSSHGFGPAGVEGQVGDGLERRFPNTVAANSGTAPAYGRWHLPINGGYTAQWPTHR